MDSEKFARAFGDSLRSFLDKKGISYAAAARRLGVERATLSTYWNEDANGLRRKARAELLFLACKELGFEFEYDGFRISESPFGSRPDQTARMPSSEQLSFNFARQFKLTEDNGRVFVELKRQPGSLRVSVSLEAAS